MAISLMQFQQPPPVRIPVKWAPSRTIPTHWILVDALGEQIGQIATLVVGDAERYLVERINREENECPSN